MGKRQRRPGPPDGYAVYVVTEDYREGGDPVTYPDGTVDPWMYEDVTVVCWRVTGCYIAPGQGEQFSVPTQPAPGDHLYAVVTVHDEGSTFGWVRGIRTVRAVYQDRAAADAHTARLYADNSYAGCFFSALDSVFVEELTVQ